MWTILLSPNVIREVLAVRLEHGAWFSPSHIKT
jgi:hypothetical protein